MKIFNRFLPAGLIFSVCVLCALSAAEAAVPGKLSYQGTLRKDGILYTGTVVMEFKITNAAGNYDYWTSGSTEIYVSGGLFRYTLGIPNEVAFAAISWGNIEPYVLVVLDGNWLPPEPLFSSAYALHARRAEGSSGDFTAYNGSIKISTTAGNIGLVFQDGTTQYTSAAPVWSVFGTDVYISSNTYGNAGIGNAAPQARLDVLAASGGYAQIWRDSSGVIQASMTATGFLYANGSRLAGAVTASSYTATSALGLGAARLELGAGMGISSASASQYGGVYVSTHMYLPSGAKYYGDGSGLTSVSGASPAGSALTGSYIWAGNASNVAAAVAMSGEGGLDNTGAFTLSKSITPTWIGVHIFNAAITANDVFTLGDGGDTGSINTSDWDITTAGAMTGMSGITNDGSYTQNGASANTFTGATTVSNSLTASSFTAANALGASLPRIEYRTNIITSSAAAAQYGGVYVSTHMYLPSGAKYYGDGSALAGITGDSLGNHIATTTLDMAGFNMVDVSTISVSSITTTAAGVIFSTNAYFINGNVGIGTAGPGSRFEIIGGSSTFRGSDSNSAIVGFTNASGNYSVVISTTGKVSVGGALRLASKTKAELYLIAPAEVGEMYFCTTCVAASTKQIVVSTGTSAGNFSDAMGGSNW
ncbi:MAG: hypothetical protein HY796_06880 [Elusimicrobia bacterium]|nr:hypothetical protein [Elusimicrobiota bacterium]